MKLMDRISIAVLNVVILPFSIMAQTNIVPRAFEVYGGTINVIDAIETTASKTRVFVSTESPNSVFYADVDYSIPAPFGTNFMFRVMPDMDANANFGEPNWIAAHQQSGKLFVSTSSGLVSCATSSGSITTHTEKDPTRFILIRDSYLFVMGGSLYGTGTNSSTLCYGTLDASGSLTLSGSLRVSDTNFNGHYVQLAVNPVNNKLYVLNGWMSDVSLYQSSDDYTAFTAGTVFTPVSMSGVNLSEIRQLAFGPDGRLFLGGCNGSYDLAWSDNNGTSWTNLNSSGGGSGKGLNIVCSGVSNAYRVYFGSAVSSNKGAAGTWLPINCSAGSTRVDPIYSNVVYLTQPKGFSCSTNAGVDITEINNGLLAFQIYDIDVLTSKSVAWIGSIAGMRRATNFNTTPVWTDGEYPSPGVTAVAIDETDPSGMTGYAAGGSSWQGIVFKTTNGGGSTSDWTSIFTTNISSIIQGIDSIKAQGNFIVFGYYTAPYDANSRSGGVFLTHNNGANWTNVLNGDCINKLLFLEENGTGVVYAAAAKTGASDQGGIYRIDTNTLTVVRDMTNDVDIRDLAADSMGGIYASGTLPHPVWTSSYHGVVAYYKEANSSEWTLLPTNGLPVALENGFMYVPITVGKDNASNDVPVLAAERTLYYLSYGGTEWVTITNYPLGSKIRTLFWDELLVGTAIGLYGQGINVQPETQTDTSGPLAADFDGDQLADPAVYNTNGNWKVKLSSANYTLIPLTGFLGGSGYTALAADFDGDGLADPAIYSAALELWAVKLSSLNYLAPTVLTSFGGSGWQAIAGDFDGDSLADPALYNTNGTWKVKLSTANYTTITSTGLLGYAGWTAISADFDGDGKVDPAIYKASTGSWIVLMSKVNYAIAVIEPGFLGNTGYIGLAADFDGDAYADPAVCETSTGNWEIKLSSGNYSKITLLEFLGE